ncbi:MAG: hypothetical protein WBQ76_11745 [Candidatus Korobacteraceae bacterium]
MFARQPDQSAKSDTGDFAKFTDFVKRLMAVPHSEIKAALEQEREAKKQKRASRAASEKD